MVRVENFLSIFAKNGQSNLVLESKGPYYVFCLQLHANEAKGSIQWEMTS